MGWGHRNTALIGSALMIVSGLVAVGVLGAPASIQVAALSTVCVLYLVLAYRVDRASAAFQRADGDEQIFMAERHRDRARCGRMCCRVVRGARTALQSRNSRSYMELALHSVLWVVPLYAILFQGFGLCPGVWRYASLPDLKRIVAAVVVGGIATTTLMFMLYLAIPRSGAHSSPDTTDDAHVRQPSGLSQLERAPPFRA